MLPVLGKAMGAVRRSFSFASSFSLSKAKSKSSGNKPRLELANSQEILEESDSSNQRVVEALYEALSSRDVATVHKLVAPDLEWWFHGPPTHQYLMRLLTGASSDTSSGGRNNLKNKRQDSSFRFAPQTIVSFGPTVLAEGCDHARSIAWVHAWTVTHGVITQIREYFNTSLTVTRFGDSTATATNSDPSSPSASDYESASPPSSTAEITPLHCPYLWESSVSDRVGKSVPGLVLAI
ncbi:hypothetical protein SO802_017242 [Lithocarpus litseifolius]|uniref:Uncharacterized protein n=1 Tax=Lithocarpus litseifolius TaxID=425828 RepID=A0AAW2CZF7_9ROSI